ncbi:MAG: glycosyltransferase [Planctomycetaceae bacterium]|nr:glycosyltransferase [Planctomycetaceae bacterium]
MKIVHAIPYMHPVGGGPPVVVDRFCRELQNQGHDVSVVTTDALVPAGDAEWVEAYQHQYPLHVVPAARRHVFGYSSQLNSMLKHQIANADLVHLHNLWSYCTGQVDSLCKRLHVPFVVSPHGMLDPHSMSRKAWKKRLYGHLLEFPRLRHAAGMIYTHPQEQLLAEQTCRGLPAGHIVPLGADDPDLTGIEDLQERLLEQYPQWRNRKRILFLGRIHPKKGLDLLLPAFADLRTEMPEAHLILAGPVSPDYRVQFEQTVREHRLEADITCTGHVSGLEKWAIYSLSNLFVLPSYQENFAITVVEALRMGVPVLLSDRVNIWSDIVDAEAGVCCPLDVPEIQKLLKQMLSDEKSRAKLGRNGQELVCRRFNWKSATNRLCQAYEIVLGQ